MPKATLYPDTLDILREHFPAGSTIYTICRHVSRSGMSRVISVIAITQDGPSYLSYQAAAALGWPCTDKGETGVKVGGCGMDMGFHLAYSLSHVLYGDGYALKHRWL
jgi:hypothetical protein